MKIDIVIPVLNQLNYLRECLDSIEATAPKEHVVSVRIIDSASTEPIGEEIVRRRTSANAVRYSHTRLVHNAGVTIPWNLGLKQSMDDGANVICISNSDVIYGPRVIEKCVRTVTELNYGACFPLSTRNAKPSTWDKMAAERAQKELGPDTIVNTGGFAGWCFWLPRRTIEKLGMFDEQFQLWFSDTDYHWRLTAAGTPAVQVEACLLHHYESRTIVSLPGGFSHAGWIKQDEDNFNRKYKRGKYAEGK